MSVIDLSKCQCLCHKMTGVKHVIACCDQPPYKSPTPVSDKGCELDTDGDGNCPIHPDGCPKPPADAALSEVASSIVEAVVWETGDCDVRTGQMQAAKTKATALLAAFAERHYDRGRLDEHRAKLTCVTAGCEQEVTAPYCAACIDKVRAEAIEECAKVVDECWLLDDKPLRKAIADRIRSLTRAGSGSNTPIDAAPKKR